MSMSTPAIGKLRAEMNVTPMVDVLLVLLVIFMITPPKKKTVGLDPEIPQPPPREMKMQVPETTIVLQLLEREDGSAELRLNQQPATFENLTYQIRNIYKSRAEKVLFLRADHGLDFSLVARAMDQVKSADQAIRIGLITASGRDGD